MTERTEKLTKEDRALLVHESPVIGPDALRIIDAHEADRAALVARTEAVESALNGTQLDLQMNDEAHVADNAALRTELAEARANESAAAEEANACHRKLGAARQLLDVHAQSGRSGHTLNALRELLFTNPESPRAAGKDIDENQREVCMVRPMGGGVLGPQAAGAVCVSAADAVGGSAPVGPPRAAAERAVLKAMAACTDDDVRDMRDIGMAPRMVAYAVLALRAVSK